MSKRIIIIAAAALIVVAALFFAFGKSAPKNVGENNAGMTGTLPSVATTPPYVPPSGATITIGTPEGGVTVSNFYRGAEISADRTSVLVKETPAYNIAYYVPDSSFNILVEQVPFAAARGEAEAAFLEVLGVSQADACKLKIKVGTTIGVDPNYAGQNLGLSFCSPIR